MIAGPTMVVPPSIFRPGADPDRTDESRFGIDRGLRVFPDLRLKELGAANGGVGMLPGLGEIAQEHGDFAIDAAVKDAAVDGKRAALAAPQVPPQPPPAGQRVRRRLPELGHVAIRREHRPRQAKVFRSVIKPLKPHEAVVAVGDDLLAISPFASIMQA